MNESVVLDPKNEVKEMFTKHLDEIKRVFGKGLTEVEFETFCGIAAALGANPYKKEIYAVKYGNAPMTVFCARDLYKRVAMSQPNYHRHYTDAVYENDNYQVINGVPTHSYNQTNRGKLVGAYSCLFKKGVDEPYFSFVKFSEYDTGKSLWLGKPETMIKKVAESQNFRNAFNEFVGTYDESENWKDIQDMPNTPIKIQPKVKNSMDEKTFDVTVDFFEKNINDDTKLEAGVEKIVNTYNLNFDQLAKFYSILITKTNLIEKLEKEFGIKAKQEVIELVDAFELTENTNENE
jgi:phage recombination protein Bet